MTADVNDCFEDEDLDDAVRSMGEQKVRRMPVMSRDKRLVGIVSLGDVAVDGGSEQGDAAGAHLSPLTPPPAWPSSLASRAFAAGRRVREPAPPAARAGRGPCPAARKP